MDYLTRKSIAKQCGVVGAWCGGRDYPRLRAIGLRVALNVTVTTRLDRREVTEVFTDLGLLHLLPQHGGLRPAELEAALTTAGSPDELKKMAKQFLYSLANKSLIECGRRI